MAYSGTRAVLAGIGGNAGAVVVHLEHGRSCADGSGEVPGTDYRTTLLPACFEPTAEGLLGFGGVAPGQQAHHTDVLIKVRPVDSFATSDQPPVGTLAGGSVGQSREPRQRNRDGSAIRKIDYEGVVSAVDILSNRLLDFNCRNTHTIPLTGVPGSLEAQPQYVEVHSFQGRNSTQTAPDPTRTWHPSHRAPHAHEEAPRDQPNRRRTGTDRTAEPSATTECTTSPDGPGPARLRRSHAQHRSSMTRRRAPKD